LVLLAYGLAAVHGWGMVLLAFTTLAFLVALEIETRGGGCAAPSSLPSARA
jgi:hypothetical protein